MFISCSPANKNRTLQNKESFKLQVGDILFQDLDDSKLCEAIELVTPGFKGANFSHIGIIISVGDYTCLDPNYNPLNHTRVLEAIPGGVVTTRIDSFLNRSHDNNGNCKVIVGRLKERYRYAIPNAISFARNKIGEDYDQVFLLNNSKYYCSELIYEAFEKDSIFKLHPMTFLHPTTKDTLPTWIDYYKDLEEEIPENKLGINPGIMSLSKKIEMVHFYGRPEGMKE